MDELSLAFEDDNEVNTKSRRKRSLKGQKNLTTAISVSTDEGIGLSTDDIDLNDSIADRIKKKTMTRKAKTNDNKKQFDSRYFFNEAVKQISDKYKHNESEDEIIDIENLEIIDNSKNTLEELRKNSFRKEATDKSVATHSTPKSLSKAVKSKQQVKNVGKICEKSSLKQMPGKCSPKAGPSNYIAIQTRLRSRQIVVPEESETSGEDEGEEEEADSEEESIEYNALVKYENRMIWMDTNHQISCLKSAIQMIATEENGLFRDALRQQAIKSIGLPCLPSGPNLVVKIIFNSRGEPNFSFYFRSPDSPLDPTEELNHLNREMIELTQIIYDLIRMNPKKRKSLKELNNRMRKQIKH